jgi:type VI secretion system secreted protein Hcp
MSKILTSSRHWLRSRSRWLLVLAAAIMYGVPFFTFEGFGAAYLKLGDIKGEATDADHKEWIDIQSFSWGMSQTGVSGGGGAGKVSVHDISITKSVDLSSPKLMLSCFDGASTTEGLISYTKLAGGRPLEYLKIKLNDILISGYKFRGSNDALPTDQLSLNFTKIEMTYIPIDPDGKVGEAVTAVCDFGAGTAQ